MNIRQQRYKENLLLGMSKYAAARKAGYSHNTAINATKNIERRCDMNAELEMAGLTDKQLAEHAAEGIKATRTYFNDENEMIVGDDWPTRFRYFDRILDLKGFDNKDNDKSLQLQDNRVFIEINHIDNKQIQQIEIPGIELNGHGNGTIEE